MAAIGIAWATDAWTEAGWVTGDDPAWASERATIVRRGGRFIFDREPDPEIRAEKLLELKRLVKPKIAPASASQQPPVELLKAVQAATSNMTRAQQTRTDRLLQQTGISMEELLIILQ